MCPKLEHEAGIAHEKTTHAECAECLQGKDQVESWRTPTQIQVGNGRGDGDRDGEKPTEAVKSNDRCVKGVDLPFAFSIR